MDFPAFPSPNNVVLGDMMSGGHSGMDLRDWFAGKVVTGIIANSENTAAGAEPTNCALSINPDFPKWLAMTAYRVADAMMAQRATSPAVKP